MSRPREARSVAMRMGVRPERKEERARREEADEEVDLVRVEMRGERGGDRRDRSRERRVVAAVERVKMRTRVGVGDAALAMELLSGWIKSNTRLKGRPAGGPQEVRPSATPE